MSIFPTACPEDFRPNAGQRSNRFYKLFNQLPPWPYTRSNSYNKFLILYDSLKFCFSNQTLIQCVCFYLNRILLYMLVFNLLSSLIDHKDSYKSAYLPFPSISPYVFTHNHIKIYMYAWYNSYILCWLYFSFCLFFLHNSCLLPHIHPRQLGLITLRILLNFSSCW